MDNFKKYWSWLPRSLKMLLIAGILGTTGLILLYTIPYSEFALYFLAGLDFVAMTLMGMGFVYLVYDSLKYWRKKKEPK